MMWLLVIFALVSSQVSGVSSNPLYPYGKSEGDTVVKEKDDGEYTLSFGAVFNFFGNKYQKIKVDVNGFAFFFEKPTGFDGTVPEDLPLEDSSRLIAVFWDDILMMGKSGHGTLYYRSSKNKKLLSKVNQDIASATALNSFESSAVAVLTWHEVAAYDNKPHKRNTFQIVLTTDGAQSYVFFNYGRLDWFKNENNDKARTGINAGDRKTHYSLPGSGSSRVLNLNKTSNIGIPGRWLLRVDKFDECWRGDDKCDKNADCTKPQGSYICSCKAGFTGNGTYCTRLGIDECKYKTHNCDKNADCKDTQTSFKCICRPGYNGDGKTCQETDECETGDANCHENANCENSVGSFSCTCKSGYSGDGINCKDENECKSGSHNCHKDATCRNKEGSFVCKCKDGFLGSGTQCQDVDECSENSHGCHTQATCTNVPGSYYCNCTNDLAGNGVDCRTLAGPQADQKLASDKKDYTGVAVAIPVVIILLILLGFAYWKYRQRKNNTSKVLVNESQVENGVVNSSEKDTLLLEEKQKEVVQNGKVKDEEKQKEQEEPQEGLLPNGDIDKKPDEDDEQTHVYMTISSEIEKKEEGESQENGDSTNGESHEQKTEEPSRKSENVTEETPHVESDKLSEPLLKDDGHETVPI